MSPTKNERQGGMHGAIESAETEIIKKVTRSEDPLRDELLWGIPNEVTLIHIATMLPRRAYEVVATLSPDWQRAFQGRMVYNARVRSQTTETFFVVLCRFSTILGRNVAYKEIPNFVDKWTLSLFSPSDERWEKLPPIPGCPTGMPNDCNYVILDGSICLVGGARSGKKTIVYSAEVYVLDLARQPLEWRRCANMQVPRHGSKIGVMHGKIFVFGGQSKGTGFEVRNEVYDPKLDAWSWIAPMTPSASVITVFSVGKQFFVCSGWMSRFPPGNQAGEEPVSDEEAAEPMSDDKVDIYGGTKLVVTVGAKGPKLISTSDNDAEDEMDGVHEIMGNRLVDLEKGLQRSPAKCLASVIEFHEQPRPEWVLRVYDLVKDQWRVFGRESLEMDNVDEVKPKHFFLLDPRDPVESVWKGEFGDGQCG